jgi:hypothetical protein
MNRPTLRAILLVTLVLALAALACGQSSTEKLAEAAQTPTNTTVVEEKPTETPVPAATEAPKEQPAEKAAPTATEAPTATPQPTATPTPQPSPTPEPEDLIIADYGFGQDGRQLGFAFVISNPNPGLAFEDTQYQVAAYDADGTVLETDSGYISLILPGQDLGIAGEMFIDEGVTVDKIEAQLSLGDAEPSDPLPTFVVDHVTYLSSEIFNRVAGVVTNPYSVPIQDLRVSAILRDVDGSIIGGGYGYLNFILANGTTGFDLSVSSAGDVATAELHPTISTLSELTLGDESPDDAQDITLHKSGFGQTEYRAGYALLVENPNDNYAIESTQYHLTAYAADGTVLAAEEGYIDVILPGQTLGIGDTISIIGDATIDHVDAQILAGDYEPSDPIPTFTSENVSYQPGDFSSDTTGEIVSPYNKDITDIRVSAIAYDDAGNIVGGGFTYLDFIPANGKAAVEVSTACSGTPATVELYAYLSSLSDFKDE